ncbi:MAG: alpha/beta fold hydrolase [Actinomycetota bacterium]|nr:alpha/beta fold hydrolase [Actinomycetota bacterium]MDQ2957048.1 alpha/beta fold hydrolase [Actinomycetota bacterium]
MPNPPAAPVVTGAEPFAADGAGPAGRIGVLVSHGFTGSPASMRDWAQRLADAGYSVRLPRLPGHGTRWQDLNATRWTDWYAEIRAGYDELAARCDTVFACGLSLGGTLVTRLAEDLADDPDSKLAGAVLVNAAYGTLRKDAPFAKYIAWAVPSRPGIGNDIKKAGVSENGYDKTPLKALVSMMQLWKLTVADLAKITVPILYFRSTEDHVVDELSGKLLHAGATSTTVTEVPLTNSYHVATMDNDAELIFDQSLDFIRQHATSETGS